MASHLDRQAIDHPRSALGELLLNGRRCRSRDGPASKSEAEWPKESVPSERIERLWTLLSLADKERFRSNCLSQQHSHSGLISARPLSGVDRCCSNGPPTPPHQARNMPTGHFLVRRFHQVGNRFGKILHGAVSTGFAFVLHGRGSGRNIF